MNLIDRKGMPLHFPGVVSTFIDWLESLPEAMLENRPELRVKTATLSLVIGRTSGIEEKLQAAEAALHHHELDEKNRNLTGIIAAARSTLALSQYQADIILVQSKRALEYLNPESLTFRFTAVWTLAFAHLLLGDRASAQREYEESLSISRRSNDSFSIILATGSVGQMQELENELYQAAETYRKVLNLSGDFPLPIAGDSHLGLARIHYQWNDLDAAERHAEISHRLSKQYDKVIDRYIISELFLAHIKMVRGDMDGAFALVAQAEQSVKQNHFFHRIPDVIAAQTAISIHRGDLAAAEQLTKDHDLPLSRAKVSLAKGDPDAALEMLETFRRQMAAKGWHDEELRATVLLALALQGRGDKEKSLQILEEALHKAEPGGFLRLFLDEGHPMRALLTAASARRIRQDYTARLLEAFKTDQQKTAGSESRSAQVPAQPLSDPLSARELEVLRLIARGLSNREIGERLYLELSTVKGHNQKIFAKLDVQRRTEAVARARELGLL